ncbi:mRNA 3' end processing factor [Ceratocystis pirilliformis]|uniref:mRNA 3' end processing factor n=1 Tax=Ceratocystis pirilliformis TaxID=259994 RepID=A0ABR3YV80_9PEZI
MLEGLGKPCSQCGRRFKNDEDGRKKRVRHMDWHFQVHQRSVKAEKHGQHRSWYPDTKDWTVSRETIDADIPEVTSTTNSAPKQPEVQYILVPDPTEVVNTACSICADKFINKWLDSAQEWVWLDTMRVGNKAYHASCYNEAFRSRNTPEPVLGKRKAESPNHFMVEGKKWRAEVV